MATRVAFLGPAGTFSEDALLVAVGQTEIDPLPRPSVYAAIRAVAEGEAGRALVPFENSIEGAVRSTLDTLAFEAEGITIGLMLSVQSEPEVKLVERGAVLAKTAECDFVVSMGGGSTIDMSAKQISVVHAMEDAFESRDAKKFGALFTDDITSNV